MVRQVSNFDGSVEKRAVGTASIHNPNPRSSALIGGQLFLPKFPLLTPRRWPADERE
jgi:hypothetical protein